MQQDNTFPIFCYSAAAILALVFFLVWPFTRDYQNSSRWLRAVFFALATNNLIWSALGFTLIFYGTRFSSHTRVALFHCKWMPGGITLGILISFAFSKFFDTKGLTKRWS
jgi:hypothetical protein